MKIHSVYRIFGQAFRARRMRSFARRFAIRPETRVLDVGGSLFNWSLIPVRPDLTMLNLAPPQSDGRVARVRWVVGGGRNLPFRDRAFDIVYSNSVIEHLGEFDSQRHFAAECQRVGRRHYVQTPNKWFPVEPHLLTPFIHWLPIRWRRRLLRHGTVWGLMTRPSDEERGAFLRDVRLLDEAEFRILFPDSTIWRERVLGLTESLIAVSG